MKNPLVIIFILICFSSKGQLKYSLLNIYAEQHLIKIKNLIKSVDFKIFIINNDTCKFYYPKSTVQKQTNNCLTLDLNRALFLGSKDDITLEIAGIGYNSNFDKLIAINPKDTLIVCYKNIKPSHKLKELKFENYVTQINESIITTDKGFKYYNIFNKGNVVIDYLVTFKKEDIKDKIICR